MKRFICYRAKECGYVVQVFEGNSIIHEYRAGNGRYDSQHSAETLQTLQKYAKESALELAKEYKIHPIHVHYSDDIEID